MDSKDDLLKNSQKITVVLNGKDFVITLKDGNDIKGAMINYLASSKQVSDVPFLTKESEAWILPEDEVWIDRQNSLHIGLWKMESQGKNLILLYRQVPPRTRVGYRYIATIDLIDKLWKVSSIVFEKIYY